MQYAQDMRRGKKSEGSKKKNRKKETKTSDVFVLKKNVMMVHTNEVIEKDGGRS